MKRCWGVDSVVSFNTYVLPLMKTCTCQPLHDREILFNGCFQYILPTQSVSEDRKLICIGMYIRTAFYLCACFGWNATIYCRNPIKVAPYSFLKSGKHMFQNQNLVHWYFVRRMKLNVWYRTAFWESETVTKKCVTVVAMATMTFQNGS